MSLDSWRLAFGDWFSRQINKRRVALEDDIRKTHYELSHIGMHGKATWDMYSPLHKRYHELQSKHLQRYGHYFKEGDIGKELSSDRSA